MNLDDLRKVQGYLDNKINVNNFDEEQIDSIFKELCDLFPKLSINELIDLYGDHIDKIYKIM